MTFEKLLYIYVFISLKFTDPVLDSFQKLVCLVDTGIMHFVKVIFHVLNLVLRLLVHVFSCNVLLARWNILCFVPIQQCNELPAINLFHFVTADLKEVIDNLWNILMVVHT